jgi:hypothetical protein
MTPVTFGDTQRSNLARELLRRAPSALVNHTAVSSSTVTTHDVRLARLLTRLNGESWMILLTSERTRITGYSRLRLHLS